MSGKQFDINAQGYAQVIAIGQLNAENVAFGDQFIGQQQVMAIGLDPIVPEHVVAKWIDRTVVQAELLGRIEAQVKLIELVAVGGFGKSLLATWLFHRVKDGFDRSLWLNFRKVPTFNEFARWVLQEIGSPTNDPRVMDEVLIKNLIHRLTEKRCLVVLDQLEAVQGSPDLESFGEFLRTWRQRGHKSVVVITARSSSIVAMESNDRLDLAGFTEAEGADFLRRQGIGAEEAGSMETLVQVAEGHPLLLGLAVSWLRQEAGGMIDRAGLDFFAGLFQKYRGDAEAQVEEIFSRLFEDLPERLQRLLLGVVVYRDAFGLEMARGMLADVEVEDLRSLVDEGFLLVRGDQWILHPLMGRLVGQALVAADQDRESHQKAINYFLLNLKSEVSSIEDCIEHLEVFHHWCELGKYFSAYKIMDKCFDFLRMRGYYRGLLLVYKQLIKLWIQPDNLAEQEHLAWTHNRLGNIQSSLGNYQSAITTYEQAHSQFNQLNFPEGKAGVLNELGSIYGKLEKYHESIHFHQKSLYIQRNTGNRKGEATSLCNLGNAYACLKYHEKAFSFHSESLNINVNINYYYGEAYALMGLANACGSLGDYQRSLDFHQQSLAIKQEIGDRSGEALSLHNLNLLYQQRGQFRKSRSYRIQAYRIWQELQLPLAALPFSDFQKRMFQYLGEDWIEQQIQIEQKLAWLHDSIGLIIFIIRWFFSPIRWIRKRLRSKK
jgi:tetratricopeptide (TPR) repeat protein